MPLFSSLSKPSVPAGRQPLRLGKVLHPFSRLEYVLLACCVSAIGLAAVDQGILGPELKDPVLEGGRWQQVLWMSRLQDGDPLPVPVEPKPLPTTSVLQATGAQSVNSLPKR